MGVVGIPRMGVRAKLNELAYRVALGRVKAGGDCLEERTGRPFRFGLAPRYSSRLKKYRRARPRRSGASRATAHHVTGAFKMQLSSRVGVFSSRTRSSSSRIGSFSSRIGAPSSRTGGFRSGISGVGMPSIQIHLPRKSVVFRGGKQWHRADLSGRLVGPRRPREESGQTDSG